MAGNTGYYDWSHIEWSEEAQPLHQICEDFQSPMIAMIDEEDLPPSLGDEVDVKAPFVVYSKRMRTKVYAENLVWNPENKQYQPSGPIVEIPKDYTGWFDVIKSNEETPKHHNTIESLAKTECKAFLSCSTVAGFRCKEEDDDLQISKEIRVYPGEVLKVLGTIKKTWKLQEGANAPTNKPSTTFLKCFDRKKRQLYLPFAHPGKFCALSESKDHKNAVCQIRGLLRLDFPILVRLVFGWPPPNFKEFTGFMRIIGQNRPESVVLHNLISTDDKFLVLEVPQDISCLWKKATNLEAIKETPQWQGVIERCMKKVFPYLITMKRLDIRYFRQAKTDLEVIDEDSAENDNQTKSKMGRMARPLDMLTFNMSDVFPRLIENEQKRSTDSWGFQFKDPEPDSHIAEGKVIDEEVLLINQGDDEEGEEEEQQQDDFDESELKGVKLRKKKPMRRGAGRAPSVACDTGALRPLSVQGGLAMPPREFTGTIREAKDRALHEREASC